MTKTHQPTDRSLVLLDALRDGLRLRILFALEHEPASVTELAASLDVPHSKVNWAVGTLKEAGIVQAQASRRHSKTISIVLETRYAGWAKLAAVLDHIARSAPSETRGPQ